MRVEPGVFGTPRDPCVKWLMASYEEEQDLFSIFLLFPIS